MSFLPQDPSMLLSYVNTKLRDCYASLAVFCEEEDAEQSALCERLRAAGYAYDEEKNAFIPTEA